MAQNAEDAQRIMKQASVHLVLSDIGLPGIDGYEFMRAFRRNSAQSAAYVPAIAVTGYAQPDDERLAREAGYDAFLAKPLDIDKLVSLIAQLTTTTP
jgi:CheY-like chemotaxis protein